MNRLRPPPALRSFRSHARVIETHLIDEVTVAIRTSSPCRCGDRIDDDSKIALARLQTLSSHFQLPCGLTRSLFRMFAAGYLDQDVYLLKRPPWSSLGATGCAPWLQAADSRVSRNRRTEIWI